MKICQSSLKKYCQEKILQQFSTNFNFVWSGSLSASGIKGDIDNCFAYFGLFHLTTVQYCFKTIKWDN